MLRTNIVQRGGSASPTAQPAPLALRAPTFREIYEAELNYVWRTLCKMGVRDADVESLAHDVFVVVHRNLGVYDSSRPLKPWLFGIAFRVASDYRRLARNKHEVLEGDFDARDTHPNPEQLVASKEVRQLVLHALERVDFDRRAVLVMYEMDGFSMAEIAFTLGIPVNTAYSRLRVARVEFCEELRKLGYGKKE